MNTQIPSDSISLSIDLGDGAAHIMGSGMVIAMQLDPTAKRRRMQNVVLTLGDLEAMQANPGALDVALEDGQAFHMGQGAYVVMQRDCTAPGRPMQNVVLAANDVAAMLVAAA